MLLAIDIGNTNINAAFFKGKKLVKRMTFGGFPQAEGMILKREISRINKADSIIIVSVSPKRLNTVLGTLRKTNKGIPIYIVGKHLKVPIKSLYNPKEIGQDRLVSAYAASRLYGTPVLIVDFGTAVTFDVVSKNLVYLGGLILPGVKTSLESIHKKTALLPEVELRRARGFIGTNTKDSIRNGMVYGYSLLCEGLIRKFKNKFKNLKVVATGGDAKLISRYSPSIRKVDADLSLKGISFLKD
ncbi:MAG: type III pantothenate kinase [Candidatus Omnitrophica bacterium]|nr:type III pantothenate kinase [Candidatus Omnitrophota bacterium]